MHFAITLFNLTIKIRSHLGVQIHVGVAEHVRADGHLRVARQDSFRCDLKLKMNTRNAHRIFMS
jgi:hypothetical protein